MKGRPVRFRRQWLPALVVAVHGVSGSIFAADSAPGVPKPGGLERILSTDTLTGDWGGLRTVAVAHGVTFSGSYIGEFMANVRGGRQTGGVYDALLQAGVDIDIEKMLGWPGATIHGTVVYPHGSSITMRKVGDLGYVSSIDAYDSVRLDEVWLEQKFLSERFSIRAGFMASDAEFAVMDTAAPFFHSAFGTPIALTNNFAMSTYPYSALGVRLRVEPVSGWSVMVGAYDGNVAPGVFPDPSPGAAPSNEMNHWGTHFALRKDEGAMLFAEIVWRTPALSAYPDDSANGGDKSASGPEPLSTVCKAGAVYHTDEFADAGEVAAGRESPRALRGNWAIYGSVERELWREPGSRADGLSAFGRATFAAPDRNLFANSFEAGLVYSGLWQSDGRDRLAIGAAWFGISDRVSEGQRRAGRPVQDYEAVIEATYLYQLTPWCAVQPDVQWVLHPGGSGELGNALVVGMRTTVTF